VAERKSGGAKLRTRLAMTTPSEVRPNASRNIQASPVSVPHGVSVTSAKRASTSTRQPWNSATVAPPKTLPCRMVVRDSGDTKISRRNPNSRSQIVDTADCTEVYMMLSTMTAGKMNCR